MTIRFPTQAANADKLDPGAEDSKAPQSARPDTGSATAARRRTERKSAQRHQAPSATPPKKPASGKAKPNKSAAKS